MANPGDILVQGDTDTMVFRKTTAETGGAYVEVEATYASMTDVRPPVHSHPHQDEHFEVLDGELAFLIEGEPHTLRPGEHLDLPKGRLHTVWNAGAEPARFVWRTTPALGTETMYETLWGLANDGKMGRHGKPRPPLLQGAVLMHAYRREYRLAAPPYPAQVVVYPALAALGWVCGFRPSYPSYTVKAS
jgi:mannose-6-phosphate isomerase-like protein (cupin superfamily)